MMGYVKFIYPILIPLSFDPQPHNEKPYFPLPFFPSPFFHSLPLHLTKRNIQIVKPKFTLGNNIFLYKPSGHIWDF